jgi:hypothetical protein
LHGANFRRIHLYSKDEIEVLAFVCKALLSSFMGGGLLVFVIYKPTKLIWKVELLEEEKEIEE